MPPGLIIRSTSPRSASRSSPRRRCSKPRRCPSRTHRRDAEGAEKRRVGQTFLSVHKPTKADPSSRGFGTRDDNPLRGGSGRGGGEAGGVEEVGGLAGSRNLAHRGLPDAHAVFGHGAHHGLAEAVMGVV